MGPPQELVLPETVTKEVNIDGKGSHGVVTGKRGRNYAREDRSKKSRRAWIGSWAFLSSEHTVRFQRKNHTPGSQILVSQDVEAIYLQSRDRPSLRPASEEEERRGR